MGKNGQKANRPTDKVTFEWLPATCPMNQNTNTNKNTNTNMKTNEDANKNANKKQTDRQIK